MSTTSTSSGWNRGNSTPKPTPKKKPSAMRGIVAGLVVVALAAACVVVFMGKGEKPMVEKTEKKPTKIKEVTPAPARKTVVEEKEAPQKKNAMRDHNELSLEELKKLPHWCWGVEDRKRIDPTYAERHEKFLAQQAKIPWRTHVDRELAMLLFAKDGNTGLLIPFDGRFAERFRKSLAEPTIVLEDDSEELKEQKRQLNETKAYLREELDKGTDIAKLLNDEMREIKKIGALRENMRKELREFLKTAKSRQEAEEFVNAANRMLKERGARSLKMPFDISLKLDKMEQMEGNQQ